MLKRLTHMLIAALALSGCASPGQEQGSSKNEAPSMNITVIVAGAGSTVPGKDGAVSVTNTSSPAAAPNASAQQDAAASVDTRAGVGDKALDAVTAGAASAATGIKKMVDEAASKIETVTPAEPAPAADPAK